MDIKQSTIPHRYRNKYLRAGGATITNGGSSVYASTAASTGSTDNAAHADYADVAGVAKALEKVLNIYGNQWSGTTDLSAITATTITANGLSASTGNIATLSATTINSTNINNSDTIKTKNLEVTGLAHFFELVIDKIKAAGGAIMLTPADGFKVDKVTSIDGGYRLYWRSTNENGKGISNMWKVNDQALCKSFNEAKVGTSYNVSNKYYWSLVTAVDESPVKVSIDGVEHDCHYIDISTTTKDGTLNPEVDDEIVMCGYRGTDDAKRQSALYISAYASMDKGITAPLFATYQGINDFDLESHRKTYIDATRAEFIGSLKVSDGTSVESLITSATTEMYNEFVVNAEGLVSRVVKVTNPNILAANGWTDQDDNAVYQEDDENYTVSGDTNLEAYPPVMYLDAGSYTMSVYGIAKYDSIKYSTTKDNLDQTLSVTTMINSGDTWHNSKRSITTFLAPVNGYYQLGIKPMDDTYTGDTPYHEIVDDASGRVQTEVQYVLPATPQVVGTSISGVLVVKPAAYNGSITYASSNQDVATVNANGVISILAQGVTTITVTANESIFNGVHYLSSNTSKTLSAATSFMTSINILSAPTQIEVDDTAVISAEVIPNTYPGTLTYSSNDEDVITVDSNGNVTGMGDGNATITITAPDVTTTSGVYYKGSTKTVNINVGDDTDTPPDDEIWYTSAHNKVIKLPSHANAFDANVVSNTVDSDGKGIIKFDAALTKMQTQYTNQTVFGNNAILTSLSLPKSVISLPSGFCKNAYKLQHVKLSNGLKTIDGYAFNGCYNLRDIKVPNTVTAMTDSYHFEDDVYLSTASVSKRCDTLKYFQNCRSLGSIKIPDSITSIHEYSLKDCVNLRSVYFNKAKSIGNCLIGCSGLTHVVFGAETETIDSTNLKDCPNLSTVICLSTTPPTYLGYPKLSGNTITVYVPSSALATYQSNAYWRDTNLQALPYTDVVESDIYVDFNTYQMLPDATQTVTVATNQPDGVIYSQVGGGKVIADDTDNPTHITATRTGNTITLTAIDDGVSFLALKVEPKVVDNVLYLPSQRLLPIEVKSTDVISSTYSSSTKYMWAYIKNGETYNIQCEEKVDYYYVGNSKVSLYLDEGCVGEELLYTSAERTVSAGRTVVHNYTYTSTNPDGWYMYSTHSLGIVNSMQLTDYSQLPHVYYTSTDGNVINPTGTTPIYNAYSTTGGTCIYTTMADAQTANWQNTKLKTIDLSNVNITSIGDNTYKNCTGLTSITIPNTVTSIGDNAFNGCTNLTSITLPNTVTSIGDNAFNGCTNLTSITLPNTVTSIGDSAFNGCTNLQSATLSDTLTTIGSQAFAGCTSLQTITIPNSVTTIGNIAFAMCSNLTSVTLSTGITSIGDYLFNECTNLQSITIPDTVTSIGDTAFGDCNLTSVTLSDNLLSIGEFAFIRCNSLQSITLPKSLTSIGACGLGYCTSLTNIIYKGSQAEWSTISLDEYWAAGTNYSMTYLNQ